MTGHRWWTSTLSPWFPYLWRIELAESNAAPGPGTYWVIERRRGWALTKARARRKMDHVAAGYSRRLNEPDPDVPSEVVTEAEWAAAKERAISALDPPATWADLEGWAAHDDWPTDHHRVVWSTYS